MLEFFIGNSKEKEAIAAAGNVQHKKRLSAKEQQLLQEGSAISRRLFLRKCIGGATVVGFGGLALALSVNSASQPQTQEALPLSFDETPEKTTLITIKAPSIQRSAVRYDQDYLINLLNRLQQPLDEITAHHRILDNLSIIKRQDGFGIGVRLDGAGYFATAAHMLLEAPKSANEEPKLLTKAPFLYNPKSGISSPVLAAIIDIDRDLALGFAPTGQKSLEPVLISIDLSNLANNERLWSPSLTPADTDTSAQLHLYSGLVNLGLELVKGRGKYPFDSSVVQGMIARPGTSGSPILNKSGQLRAIVSGQAFMDELAQSYAGAVVAPIATFSLIAQMQPRIFSS